MHRPFSAVFVLLVVVQQASAFLFGGGCCGAPAVSSCCGGATSWAYAPPQVIGYERIPLYAKVPMPLPPPPPSYVQPPPSDYAYSQNVAIPQGYQQRLPQQYLGQVENGIDITPNQISSVSQPRYSSIPTSNYIDQSSSLGGQSAEPIQTVASSAAYEETGIAPSARRLRKFKN